MEIEMEIEMVFALDTTTERLTVIGMAVVTGIAMVLLLVDIDKTIHLFHNCIRNYFHHNAYRLCSQLSMDFLTYRY